MLFVFLIGIGSMGNFTSMGSLKTFKSLIECAIQKNIIVKNFTLVSDENSTDIYEFYLKNFRNDFDLHYSNQQNSEHFFCN